MYLLILLEGDKQEVQDVDTGMIFANDSVTVIITLTEPSAT